MNSISYDELVHGFLNELKNRGYQEKTIQMYRTPLDQIALLHRDARCPSYSQEIVDSFVARQQKRYQDGEIRKGTFSYYRLPAMRLENYRRTGNTEMHKPARTPPHTPYFESILDSIRSGGLFSGGEHNHFVSLANRYFTWLEQNGIRDLHEIVFDTVRDYISFNSERVCGNTLAGLKRRLRMLHQYFVSEGFMDNDFSMLLSLPVAVEKRILPAMSHDEVYSMLGSIDRTTAQGKLEYAIILLGFVTGLRACDIARLRLSDIDWVNGEIRILQSKTGNALSLPLTEDIGSALQQYILYARPESGSDRVFLQLRAPYCEYRNGMAFSQTVERVRKRAGLPISGFHGLPGATWSSQAFR